MKMKKRTNRLNSLLVCLVPAILLPLLAAAQDDAGQEILPLPRPEQLEIMDAPHDDGETLLLKWPRISGETEDIEYVVYRGESREGPWEELTTFASNTSYGTDFPKYFGFDDDTNEKFHIREVTPLWEEQIKIFTLQGKTRTIKKRADPRKTFYKLAVRKGTREMNVDAVVSGIPHDNWFRKDRANGLIILVSMFFFVTFFIAKAIRNPNIFLRKIPGIDAVDEAVGRATEMGKPILYTTGYYDIQELSCICSVNILAHVAKKVAQYDSRLIVPCKWPVAMTVCQEVVREAYINAGRPDAFNINDIFFVAGEQFSYTIGVDSIMVRERPAANFFLGTFAAEALILAETGASTGAIQIAGTDSNYQIPFFVVACDYCLIGEELYAASAYLARNPKLIGSLKAQDAGKMILFFGIILGAICVSLYAFFGQFDFLESILHFFTVR